MGASASALSATIRSRRLKKEELDPVLLEYFDFEDYKDSSNTMSVEQLINVMTLKTDVFLTHDWGVDQDNHKRVAKINAALKSKGLITWFDEEKMEGNVREKMLEGINNCKCVVVFITKRYMDKVASDNAGDNCKLEFNFAALKKGNSKMVPVVMEPEVRNTKKWHGMVDFELSGLLYVDFGELTLSQAKVDELHSRIMSIINKSLQSVFESLHNTLVSGSPLPSTSGQHESAVIKSSPSTTQLPPSGGGDEDFNHIVEAKLVTWLVQDAQIAPGNAKKYAPKMVDAGIASVDRLAKKISKNSKLLLEMGVDEDDNDDILKAIHSKYASLFTTTSNSTSTSSSVITHAVPETVSSPMHVPVAVPVPQSLRDYSTKQRVVTGADANVFLFQCVANSSVILLK